MPVVGLKLVIAEGAFVLSLERMACHLSTMHQSLRRRRDCYAALDVLFLAALPAFAPDLAFFALLFFAFFGAAFFGAAFFAVGFFGAVDAAFFGAAFFSAFGRGPGTKPPLRFFFVCPHGCPPGTQFHLPFGAGG